MEWVKGLDLCVTIFNQLGYSFLKQSLNTAILLRRYDLQLALNLWVKVTADQGFALPAGWGVFIRILCHVVMYTLEAAL